jgi:hypothetical protein
MAEVGAALVRANPDHFPDDATRIDLLYRTAHRIAVNRTVAGVHFPVDSWLGAIIGRQVGRVLVGLMAGGNRPAQQSFDPNALADRDFLYSDVAAMPASVATGTAIVPDPVMAWLWSDCLAEFTLGGTP